MRPFALFVCKPSLRWPVLGQPRADFPSEGVCFGPQVPLGKRGRRISQIPCCQLLADGPPPSVPHHVAVDALEMPRRFVIFRIPDRAKGVMSFKGYVAQLGVGKGKGGRSEDTPFGYAAVKVGRSAVENALRSGK